MSRKKKSRSIALRHQKKDTTTNNKHTPKRVRVQAEPKLPRSGSKLVYSIREFLALKPKARKFTVEGFLQEQSLVMVYGPKSQGKTNFGFAMCRAFGAAEKFMNTWDVKNPHRCLYIDGEMADTDSAERFKKFMSDSPEALDNCFYLSSEITLNELGDYFNFTKKESQDYLLNTLAMMEESGCKPEILFFDNIASLMTGISEDVNADQDEYLAFFRKLRHIGYIIIFFHHCGVDEGRPRGATKRFAFCDLVISLGKPKKPPEHCKFIMTFPEKRKLPPQPSRLICELLDDGKHYSWLTKLPKEQAKITVTGSNNESWIEILEWIDQNHPTQQTEIADSFKVSEPRISQILKKPRKLGYLKNLTITKTGREFVNGRVENAD